MGEQRVRVMVGEGQTTTEGSAPLRVGERGLRRGRRSDVHAGARAATGDPPARRRRGGRRDRRERRRHDARGPALGEGHPGVATRRDRGRRRRATGALGGHDLARKHRRPADGPRSRDRAASPSVLTAGRDRGPGAGARGTRGTRPCAAPGAASARRVRARRPATYEPPMPEAPPANVVEEATVAEALVEEPAPAQPAPPTDRPEPLSNVLMRPADLASPSWTYTAPGEKTAPPGDRRRRTAVIVLAVVAGLLAIALVATLRQHAARSPPRSWPAASATSTLPGSGRTGHHHRSAGDVRGHRPRPRRWLDPPAGVRGHPPADRRPLAHRRDRRREGQRRRRGQQRVVGEGSRARERHHPDHGRRTAASACVCRGR